MHHSALHRWAFEGVVTEFRLQGNVGLAGYFLFI